MTHRSRLALAAALALTAVPALAGNFAIERLPRDLVLAPLESCPHDRAVTVMTSNEMRVVATVPRLKSLHRFVVDWKSDLFAVTVRVTDCRIDVIDYAKAIHPYCEYIPGIVPACRPDLLAQ